MIRLVVTDLDGTLLMNDSTLSQTNIEAIKALHEAGVLFVIASGRGVGSIRKLMASYDLEPYIDGIIGFNGAYIYLTGEDRLIEEAFLPKEAIVRIVENLEGFDLEYAVHVGEGLLVSNRSPYVGVEQEVNGYGLTVLKDFKKEIASDYPKLMIIGDGETLNQVEVHIKKDPWYHHYNVLRSHEYFLEILEKGVSKGDALEDYLDLRGIGTSQVIAFGDQMNDAAMLQVAGHAYAMENASIEVKAIAKKLAPSNEANGFSMILKELRII